VYYPLGQSQVAVQQAVPGLPTYLFGTRNRLTNDTKIKISTVALAGTTATVVGTVVEGLIPVVGQLVTINGAVPPYFNVVNAKILSVSAALVPDAGVYTITFALTNSGIGTTNSPGVAIAPQIETGDALAINNGSTNAFANSGCSQAVSIQENVDSANGKSIRCDVTFPTVPGAVTVNLQTAAYNIDSEFVDAGTVATVTGGIQSGQSVVIAAMEALYCRYRISGLAGNGTIVGKITI
jgi:hypothetical protein